MPVTTNKSVHGRDGTSKVIAALQTSLSLPVIKDVDHQLQAAKIIELQKALNSPKAPVCKSIDNERLGEKLMQLQDAINNP